MCWDLALVRLQLDKLQSEEESDLMFPAQLSIKFALQDSNQSLMGLNQSASIRQTWS